MMSFCFERNMQSYGAAAEIIREGYREVGADCFVNDGFWDTKTCHFFDSFHW